MLEHAFRNSQVLITLDKDFGELAVVLQRPHVGMCALWIFAPKIRAQQRLQPLLGTGRTFPKAPS